MRSLCSAANHMTFESRHDTTVVNTAVWDRQSWIIGTISSLGNTSRRRHQPQRRAHREINADGLVSEDDIVGLEVGIARQIAGLVVAELALLLPFTT